MPEPDCPSLIRVCLLQARTYLDMLPKIMMAGCSPDPVGSGPREPMRRRLATISAAVHCHVRSPSTLATISTRDGPR